MGDPPNIVVFDFVGVKIGNFFSHIDDEFTAAKSVNHNRKRRRGVEIERSKSTNLHDLHHRRGLAYLLAASSSSLLAFHSVPR